MIGLIFVVGLGLLLYPSVSNYWNSMHQTRVIMGYNESVAQLQKEDYDKILRSAKKYNKELGKTGIRWRMTEEQKKEYQQQLDIDGTGVMGYIAVPRIHVRLPIYHGTEEGVLQTSIGHLEGSSLPVGGKNSHCLVSGHRGLPSAKLFSDLDKIREGDTWTMTVLNETVTYEADQIRIVEPDDLSEVQIVTGKDYCTLITCTPYGVNTHRLLVRGHRIPNINGDANVIADAIQIEPIYIAPFLAAGILVLLLVMMLIRTRGGGKGGRGKKRSRGERYLDEKGLRRPAQRRMTDQGFIV